MKLLTALLLILLTEFFLTGCTAARLPARAYRAAYCERMQPDGKHCQVDGWATPNGRLKP